MVYVFLCLSGYELRTNSSLTSNVGSKSPSMIVLAVESPARTCDPCFLAFSAISARFNVFSPPLQILALIFVGKCIPVIPDKEPLPSPVCYPNAGQNHIRESQKSRRAQSGCFVNAMRSHDTSTIESLPCIQLAGPRS